MLWHNMYSWDCFSIFFFFPLLFLWSPKTAKGSISPCSQAWPCAVKGRVLSSSSEDFEPGHSLLQVLWRQEVSHSVCWLLARAALPSWPLAAISPCRSRVGSWFASLLQGSCLNLQVGSVHGESLTEKGSGWCRTETDLVSSRLKS